MYRTLSWLIDFENNQETICRKYHINTTDDRVSGDFDIFTDLEESHNAYGFLLKLLSFDLDFLREHTQMFIENQEASSELEYCAALEKLGWPFIDFYTRELHFAHRDRLSEVRGYTKHRIAYSLYRKFFR